MAFSSRLSYPRSNLFCSMNCGSPVAIFSEIRLGVRSRTCVHPSASPQKNYSPRIWIFLRISRHAVQMHRPMPRASEPKQSRLCRTSGVDPPVGARRSTSTRKSTSRYLSQPGKTSCLYSMFIGPLRFPLSARADFLENPDIRGTLNPYVVTRCVFS